MCGILKDNCRVVLSHVTSAARVFGISHGSEKKVEDTAFEVCGKLLTST